MCDTEFIGRCHSGQRILTKGERERERGSVSLSPCTGNVDQCTPISNLFAMLADLFGY